jgi:RNA polymerase sigma factor (sigma-70 family)
MTNADLIAACKNGDRGAQRTLFEQYARAMLQICRRYISNSHDAEEVMLNGFYKFFASIERFRYQDERSVGAWLKKIVLNECLMFLRRTKRISIVEEGLAAEVALDETVLEQMNAGEIMQAIDGMPDGYRIVFSLYVIEGYDHKEIAAMLDITEGGSKSQLSRARAFLQHKIMKKEGIL